MIRTIKDGSARVLIPKNILEKESDEDHLVPMSSLIAALEDQGINADRRTIYHDIQVLNENGVSVLYDRHGQHVQGYYIEHVLSPAEAVILAETVQDSLSLSEEDGKSIADKLLDTLSIHQRSDLRLNPPSPGKTDNKDVLTSITLILQAIQSAHPISFRYYDYTVTRQKKYRRSSHVYQEVPYAVITDSGRLYCVLYSSIHQSFGAWRVDKMDSLAIVNEPAELKPFDLERWMQASFRMYTGKPETITCEFDLSLLNQVYDQFGRNILISKVTDTSFTASIQGSITPTLISWLLQFYDRITVKKPASLIRQLKKIADSLQKQYGD